MRTDARSSLARGELPASHHVPYSMHVSPHVVKTEAGDYLQVFRIHGLAFETADDEDLNNWHERLNVTWRNVASANVSLWTHVIRRRERVLPSDEPTDGFAGALKHKYRQQLARQTLMLNELYLSVIYRPFQGTPMSPVASVLRIRYDEPAQTLARKDALDVCEKLAQTLIAALASYEPERLGIDHRGGRDFSTPMEFFSALMNAERAPRPLPRASIRVVLATTRPLFGSETIEYRSPTQTRFGAMLGIKEYPTSTTVGMYDALLSAPFEFVLTQSFSFLAKATGQGLLQRQYHRMSNAGDFAVTQSEELKDALDALTANEFVMGDHHLSLQILTEATASHAVDAASSLKTLNDHVALARTMLADCGMTVAREDLALEAAFWAQLPANFALRPRKAPITSRNFAAMVPLHNYPVGRATGNHWGDALTMLVTSARSPYYFSLHASDPREPDGGSRKDTGHTFICGPTGSGKTVVIGFWMSMLHTQGVTQVVFDKDYGLEILVCALGGEYRALRNGEPTGFNPLQLEPTPANVEFLKRWLRMLVRGQTPLGAREETDLEQALRGTLALAPEARRLSRLIEFTDSTRHEGVYARLSKWCHSTRGEYAWAFDNESDVIVPRLREHAIVGFDVTHFLNHEVLRGPVNGYLFHLVEQLVDGRKLVCWVDEFSNALADPDFQSFADNAPKTWRKLNGALCMATQTARSVLASPIARTLVEQTATMIFFPNPNATVEDYVEGFGLTEREFTLIKEQIEPGSRMFLVKQGHWSVLCELDLRGFTQELTVISGRRESVERLHWLVKRHGADPAHWLASFMGEGESAGNVSIRR
ncbi:VirB4 family type IV secretion/conjugal transfer ATPase [Steroidobacter flavus]|uniref:VirB4 family type IV secretion/conjugal transfer ATPase n=1 Tax=Steroidobacter flavus TaxID=1842136 RepID=A0ABV8SX58_9GAMM